MKKLPEDIKREINRLAHAIAQWSYGEHRRKLETDARALLAGGQAPGAVIGQLRAQALKGRQ